MLIGKLGVGALLLAVAAVAAAPAMGGVVLSATADTWVRESQPNTTYDADTISAWSSGAPDGKRRYALLEFDVSALAGQPLQSASLSLFSFNRWSQRNYPIKQTAYVITSTGATPLESLTWNLYMAERDASKVPLESLGRYENGPISSDPTQQEVYITTQAASPADLLMIEAEASGDGLLTLVLIADEDGTAYARDWGDKDWAKQPALLNVEVVPEPATAGLALLAGASLLARRRRSPG